MKHVISTLSADTRYTDHSSGRGVLVKGAMVMPDANSLLGYGLRKSAGVLTEVSDEDAAFLANHHQFKVHQQRGFMKIVAQVARGLDQC